MIVKKLIVNLSVAISLILITYIAVWVRSGSINTQTVTDYDPWWWYRHAKAIVENNFHIPKWDIQSFYPPGRPYEPFQGWPYTIAVLYKILNFFHPITLMKTAILSPLIMVALTIIPAFFVGRILSNNIGGIAVAIFAVLTPTFLSVSMGGYSDSDAPVVFHMLLSVLSVMLVLKYAKYKWKATPLYLFAILVNIFFVFNWGGGWLPLILFLALIPSLLVFRIIERFFHTWKFKLDISTMLPEFKSIVLPLLIIFVVTNITAYVLWGFTMFHSLLGGLAFTSFFGKPLIVNISVAELQPINIFTKPGFWTVSDRVGLAPFLLALFGLPILVLFKLIKKEKINFVEIFLFVWALVMFILISKGIRFSLLFSLAAAVSAGYVIGNMVRYLKKRIFVATFFGVIAVLSVMFISNAIQSSYAISAGMQISQNWYDALDWLKKNADKDSLISTWWDPGHIIAGYTGLKVQADGAHCGPDDCIPYNHDIRIVDTGRMFTTNNESEVVSILNKYRELTPQQCQEARNKFGDKMPADACKTVSDFYVIASSDLIGKYYWMSYFGSYNYKSRTGNGKNFMQIPFSGQDKNGLPTFGNIITLFQKDNKIFAVLNIPQQGIRNTFIKEVVLYQGDQEIHSVYSENNTNVFDGMLLVDPSFGGVILMDPSIRDSIFTKMFFFGGADLQQFKLVYSNPELKIYKLD